VNKLPKLALIAPPNAEHLTRYLSGCGAAQVDAVVITPSKLLAAHCAQSGIDHVFVTELDKVPREAIEALKSVADLVGIVAAAEFAVEPAENIAIELGLSRSMAGNPAVLRNKHDMRLAFATAGVRQPRVEALARSPSELRAAISAGISYPAICKPVDMAGSWFVTLNHSADELLTNAMPVFECRRSNQTGLALAGHCVIEQFIGGSEFSAEIVVVDGAIEFVAVTKKTTSSPPYFDEIAHVCGVELPVGVHADLISNLRNVVIAAQVMCGVLHAEFKVFEDKVYIIEVACRIPGDQITHLVELAYGVVLEHVLIRAKLGLPLEISDRAPPVRHGIRFLFEGDEPVTADGPGVVEARSLPAPLQPVLQPTSATHITRRRAYVIHSGDELAVAE
jgi:biotin carboxylase